MATIKTYTQTKSTSTTLPKEFQGKPDLNLLAQVKFVLTDNKHLNLGRAKTRSEIVLSRKKIYKQKGTGGARHGAKSAPIFIGGGAAHGPKGLKRALKINTKMRALAISHALSLLAANNKLVFVSGIGQLTKTKDAQILVNNIRKDYLPTTQVTVVLTTSTAVRFFRNLKNVVVTEVNRLNALDALSADLVAMEEVSKGNSASKPTKKSATKIVTPKTSSKVKSATVAKKAAKKKVTAKAKKVTKVKK